MLSSSRFGGKKGSPTAAVSPGGQAFDFNDVPPIREPSQDGHGEEDERDSDRITYATYMWDSQDDSVRRRDRQIEENIRMLSGQQWSVFNPRLGRFIDVTNWMTSDEKKWRQRPVFNRLLPWFIITHARMTENPPIVTFIPGPDRDDAMLASTLDVIFKKKWREINMASVWDRASAWLIPSGTVYLQSTINLRRGEFIQFAGQPQEEDMEGLTPEQQELLSGLDEEQEVGYDEQGAPMFGEDGQPMGGEEGHFERKGDLDVAVHNAVQVRGEWTEAPWHEKSWHLTRTFHSTNEIMELYGVNVEGYQVPNQGGSDTGIAERFNYGSGYFGAADPNTIGSDFSTNVVIPQPTVEVFTLWHRPAKYAGMEEGPDEPGGRLLVVTRTQVLHDSTRPVAYRYTSPIRQFTFVNLPGRPAGGTTPQESMNQPQRMYNRTAAGLLEHTNLSVNPIKIIDSQSGLEERQVTNRPGLGLSVNRRANIPPFEWVAPPPLSPDVYRTLEFLRQEIDELGNLEGTEGGSPTEDASGELVKELRFNSDRFLGPTMRRSAEEFGRMVEDWIAIFPALYDDEEILSYAGADNVARTIMVRPDLFESASVNVQADVESMLPEGRGERQKNITALYSNGLFGMPGTPAAVSQFFELSRFPHLGRAGKFGGIHRITADQENGKLLQGMPAQELPVFEWYNDQVHLMSHEEFMASPEFLELDPQQQQQFVMHRQMHIMNIMMKASQMAEASPEGSAGPSAGGEGGSPPSESQPSEPGAAALPEGESESPTGPTLE